MGNICEECEREFKEEITGFNYYISKSIDLEDERICDSCGLVAVMILVFYRWYKGY